MKKRVAIHTDHSKIFTGFSKFKRAILRYLFNTGKYDLFEFSNGLPINAPELEKLPWPCFSTAPNAQEQDQMNSCQDQGQREALHRQAAYGRFGVPRLLKDNSIDVLISSQDSWGVDFLPSLPEVKNVTFIPHVTIDSENLLPSQVDLAGAVEKLYVWASFAIREYKKWGFDNVEYLPGCVDSSSFFPLPKDKKAELRKKFGLEDSFSIIYTARSQLRKLFPNLMDGFKLFKEQYPESKAKLILLTSAQEGWNIQELIRQRDIKNEDVYLCYFCKACGQYELRPFFGHDQNCPFCKAEKLFNTINICHGISESQLNECYNCCDLFASVMTSGGMEIAPSIEAKCAGLTVACTSYSCGEDIVGDDRGGINIEYEKYYECPTAFVKASSQDHQIKDAIEKAWKMSPDERESFGLKGREFVLENISPEAIGKRFENLIDAAPLANWENWEPALKNPEYVPPQGLSAEDFLISIFTNVLHEKVDKNTTHIQNWKVHLEKSNDYKGVLAHFQNIARQQNGLNSQKPVGLEEMLDKDDEGKRLAIVLPESAGDIIMINSLLKKFKALYSEFNIYFFTKPEFFDLLEGHESIFKLLPYSPAIDSMFFLTGIKDHKGLFELAFFPGNLSQKTMSYQNNDYPCRAEWLV